MFNNKSTKNLPVTVSSNKCNVIDKPVSSQINVYLVLIVVCLVLHLIINNYMPKVTVDSDNSNSVSVRKPVIVIPPEFEEYGRKADQENTAATNNYTKEIDRLCDSYKYDLKRYAASIAEKKCTYSNCVKLIGYMAKDYVFGSNDGESYLSELIQHDVNSKMSNIATNLNDNLINLQKKLNNNTESYANKVCILLPSTSILKMPEYSIANTPDFRITLSKLGLSGAFNSIALALEAKTLISTGCFSSLRSYLARLAAKAFSGPIKKAAISVILSLCDGPLPIGDIIGAIGLVWTANDIKCMRDDFESNVSNSIYNQMQRELEALHQQAATNGHDLYNQYISLRKTMAQGFQKEFES